MSASPSPRASVRTMDVRKGTVLIVTIWVVLVLAGLALVFAGSVRVAGIVSANHIASLGAECIASGALEYVLAMLSEGEPASDSASDASELYEAQQVGQGYFWVLQANLEDDREFKYGPADEAAKINLNSASQEMLLKLPGMTAELAASIIDWRDEDSDVTTGGAEDEYYLLQSEPYHCKNAPLETVDEVLLIKGASEELLYGEDTNLNGILDDHENDGDASDPPDNRNGRLDGGFYDYVTVYSVEANVDAQGNTRINVSDASARGDLSSALQEAVGEERALEIMSRVPTNPSFSNVLDFHYRVGLTLEEFSAIVDQITTSDAETLPGLVNVNTAPKEVLMCLPELEEADAESLLSHRASSTSLDSIAWVTEALDREKAVAIGSHITVRSSAYSADIVCLSVNGRAYKRYKAVIDTRQTPARVVYWKTLTHFGWPLEPDIMTTLRKGLPITSVLSMN